MSRSDRDQRSRPHSGKRCPESAAGGCVWCRTGSFKQADRRIERHQGRETILEQQVDDRDDRASEYEEHVYLAGRCVRCDISSFDGSLWPELRECPGKAEDEPIVYSTATDASPSSSHPIAD